MKTVLAGVLWRKGDYGTEVLAARRKDVGLWEFPGGKLEDGETPTQALQREWREEFDVQISLVHEVLSHPIPIDDCHELRAWWIKCSVQVVPGSDHDGVCWLPLEEYPSLNWSPADKELCKIILAQLADN